VYFVDRCFFRKPDLAPTRLGDEIMNDFQGAIPILNVKNLDASVDYYVNKLGFQKRWGEEGFVCVERGKVAIFLCHGAQGRPGMWMSIFLKDVDALYAEYQKSGAIIIEPPMNFPWEHREMLISDLDGHRLRMSGDPTGPPDDGYRRTERSRSQP
jgi:predicted enzyme related to lactoylglutathione lyase